MNEEEKTTSLADSVKVAIETLTKFAASAITLLAEIALAAFIGSTVGTYYNAKSIQTDCQKVNLAKVGDVYIQCTIVEPKKDLNPVSKAG